MAQAATASLGAIPLHALAVGVEVEGATVRWRFQVSEATPDDEEEIEDTVGDFEGLVGPNVQVDRVVELLEWRRISPHDGVWWIYLRNIRHEPEISARDS